MVEMKSINETAEKYGITPHYARSLALSGRVKAVRIGKGKILINLQSVEDYFNSSCLTDEQPTPTTDGGGIRPVSLRMGR